MSRRFDSLQATPGNAFEWDPDQIREELQRYAVLRAVYSRRQVHESLVACFADHLNVAVSRRRVAQLAPHYFREAIRPHVLGRFRDLIAATARSPAMLEYLDGADNALREPGDRPQENYARELLELHTLGVHGGYSQRDVMEAARCLTGWTVRQGWRKGAVEFRPEWHDDGEKQVLGVRIPAGGGAADLDRLIDVVVDHPSTARHVATRLVRWFVADPAPADAVGRAQAAFVASGGDLRPTVRAVLTDPALQAAPPRLKRPFRLVVSALRALACETHASPALLTALERMGQRPHAHPTPEGYPLEAHPWHGSLPWRWQLARRLVDGGLGVVPWGALRRAVGEGPERWFAHLCGRAPTAAELAPIRRLGAEGGSPRDVVALWLSAPAFQVH